MCSLTGQINYSLFPLFNIFFSVKLQGYLIYKPLKIRCHEPGFLMGRYSCPSILKPSLQAFPTPMDHPFSVFNTVNFAMYMQNEHKKQKPYPCHFVSLLPPVAVILHNDSAYISFVSSDSFVSYSLKRSAASQILQTLTAPTVQLTCSVGSWLCQDLKDGPLRPCWKVWAL